jgi:hypothetical protein
LAYITPKGGTPFYFQSIAELYPRQSRGTLNWLRAAISEIILDGLIKSFGSRGVWYGEVIWWLDHRIGEQNRLNSETFSKICYIGKGNDNVVVGSRIIEDLLIKLPKEEKEKYAQVGEKFSEQAIAENFLHVAGHSFCSGVRSIRSGDASPGKL